MSSAWWIRPSVPASRCPEPPHCAAMISAAMLTAVSSGVRAPRSSPIGEDSRARCSSERPSSRSRFEPVVVGTPRAHRADVGHLGEPERHLEQGYVELRVVGEHADGGPPVDPAGRDLGVEVAVRPVDDDLVRLGEAGRGREHGPGVADRDVVAEERADPGDRGGEVDRAEDQHPRLRARRPTRTPACPRRGVRRRGRRTAPRCGRGRAGRTRRRGSASSIRVAAQARARRLAGAQHRAAAEPRGVGVLDDGGHGDRASRPRRRRRSRRARGRCRGPPSRRRRRGCRRRSARPRTRRRRRRRTAAGRGCRCRPRPVPSS